MKKYFIAFFTVLTLTVNAQEECTLVKVQANLIDSIIMMPNVKQIDVSSVSLSDKFSHYQSTVFSIVENFLVVDNNLYFDLNKIIFFRRLPKVLHNGDMVEFYFE